MGIYRGTGGTGDSTTDTTVTTVTEKAAEAASSATSAANSATSAANSASSASTSETNAATSETNAANSATASATSATASETAKTAAQAAQTAAETAQANAETAEANAVTAKNQAVSAKDNAVTAQTAAETAETNAETAYANTLAIFGDATDVQNAVDSASASATTATTKAAEAASSATDASNYSSSAGTSATQAASSASQAATSANTAGSHATDAETAKDAAETAQAAAEAAEANINGLYLGSLADDPTLDGNGVAVTTGDLYFNTTAQEVRVYTDGDVWEPVVDLAGDITVNSLTSNNNVVVKGNLEVQGTTITVDSATAQTIDLGDNDKIRLGDTDDLQIYHDGTDSYITNTTGTLKLSGNTDVTGNITVSGTVDGRDVATDGSKLDGIEAGATADQTKADIDALAINADQVDGLEASQFLRSDANDTATGNITVNGLLKTNTADSSTDGLNIENTGGAIVNQYFTGSASTDEFVITRSGTGGAEFRINSSGAVRLGHAGNGVKFETTSSGVDITGDLVADGLTVSANTATFSAGTSGDMELVIEADTDNNDEGDSPSLVFKQDGGNTIGRVGLVGNNNDVFTGSIANSLYIGNDELARIQLYTDLKERLRINTDGDISFYDDAGTSQDFYWDASISRLGLGTTSPSKALHVQRGYSEILSDGTNNTSSALVAGVSVKASNYRKAGFTIYDESDNEDFFIGRPYASTNQFVISNDTTDRLRINNAGDVILYADDGTSQDFYWDASTSRLGLGTTSPASPLDIRIASDRGLYVEGSASTPVYLRSYQGGTSSNLREIGVKGLNIRFETGPGSGTTSYERMRIDDVGRVGIGTTSPSAPLQVKTTSNNAIRVTRDGAEGQYLELNEADGSKHVIKAVNGAGASKPFEITNNWGDIRFRTSASSGGDSEAMRIDSNGKVGIGTQAPGAYGTAKFVVEGGDIIVNNNLPMLYLRNTSGNIADLRFASGIRFTNSGASEYARIDSSGNLLVGTTSQISSGKVSISGGTSASGITATTDATSGYSAAVFKRTASDGALITFQNDVNVDVGIISTNYNDMFIGTGDTGLYFSDSTDDIQPFNPTTTGSRDNAISLGRSNRRFKDLYLSGGVYLGGTGSANLLDDYEEGDWTPTIAFGGASTGITYSQQDGRYTKIGNQVTVHGIIILSSKGTATGTVTVGSLPFAVGSYLDSTSIEAGGVVSYFENFAFATNGLVLNANDGTSSLFIRFSTAGSGASTGLLNNSHFNNNSSFRFSITYFT